MLTFPMILRKFPSINQFRHVVESVTHRAEYTGQDANDQPIFDAARRKPTLTFRGTVKLHGSNAGIAYDLVHDTTKSQSRERILTIDEDNHGFCAWAESTQGASDLARLKAALLAGVAKHGGEYVALRVYGEWCGREVNAKTGIGQLPVRWMVFGVLATDAAGDEHWLSVDQAGADWAAAAPGGDSLIQFITDFPSYRIDIDFNSPADVLELLEQLTLGVEASCPVAAALGVEGIGEGIVWICSHPVYGYLVFKTKGSKHKGTKNSRLVQIQPEVLASLEAFTEAVVTESRLEQGFDLIAADNRGKVTMDHMGRFLMWVGQDVMKEEADTLKASGLDRKMAMGRVNARAKTWLLPRLAQV